MIGTILFTIWQWTWGVLQTTAGAILYLRFRNREHFRFHGACVTIWDRNNSLSLGKFIFLGGDRQEDLWLLQHEYGHCIQSMILGPVFLLIVGLPSAVWCNLPYFEAWRGKHRISYYDLYCEKNANRLGRHFR